MGSSVHLCHRGNVTLKVIFVWCSTIRGSNLAEAVMGNGKEHRRNLKGQFYQQNSNGERGAKVKRIKPHHCYLMGRHKDTGWTERKKGRGETETETPANCLDEVLPLPSTELIVCSHLLTCFFPEPPIADSACSKLEGNWCGSCTMGRSVPGTRSTSLFSFVYCARLTPQGFNWLKCKSTTSYPPWHPVLENVCV